MEKQKNIPLFREIIIKVGKLKMEIHSPDASLNVAEQDAKLQRFQSCLCECRLLSRDI